MRKTEKRLAAWALSVSLLGTGAFIPSQAAAEEYRFYANEALLPASAAPYRVGDELMVPVRPIMDAFGVEGYWVEEGARFAMTIGSRSVVYEPGSTRIVANSRSRHNAVAPQLKDGKLYVPASSLRDDLRLGVRWSAASRSIVIEAPLHAYVSGLQSSANELAYCGETKNGLPHGKGSWTKEGELVYEGGFRNGTMHGQGKLYRNGVLYYEGAFAEGRAEGMGELRESANRQYAGQFVRSQPHGTGSLYENGRLMYSGDWEDGDISGSGRLYDGEGRLTYDGELLRGQRQGYGVAYEAGKAVYAGDWSAGVRAGWGKSFGENGDVEYAGGWLNGDRHGEGSLFSKEMIKMYESDGTAILSERNVRATVSTPVVYANGKLLSQSGGFLYLGLDSAVENDWLESAGIDARDVSEDALNGLAEIRAYGGKRATEAGVVVESMREYTGQLRDGRKHGFGREYKDGKLVYEGNFKEGKRHGSGRSYVDGMAFYDGEWSEGVPHGSGRTFKYDASEPDVKAVGIAEMTEVVYREGQLASTSRTFEYFGDIAGGTLTGSGILLLRSSDGKLEKWYEGGFLNGKYAGTGTLYGERGRVAYTGGFANGLPNGTGREYLTGVVTGAGNPILVYAGQYKDGLYHGEGVLYYQSGFIRYRGSFVNGRMQGTGRLYYDMRNAGTGEQGIWYAGTFRNDKRHGYGTLYTDDGAIAYEGEFVNGERGK